MKSCGGCDTDLTGYQKRRDRERQQGSEGVVIVKPSKDRQNVDGMKKRVDEGLEAWYSDYEYGTFIFT